MEQEPREKVPTVGLEPTHPCGYQILSLGRLPIPPRRLFSKVSHRSIYCANWQVFIQSQEADFTKPIRASLFLRFARDRQGTHFAVHLWPSKFTYNPQPN